MELGEHFIEMFDDNHWGCRQTKWEVCQDIVIKAGNILSIRDENRLNDDSLRWVRELENEM